MALSSRKKLAFALVAFALVALVLEGGIRVREKILYGTFARAGTTIYAPSQDKATGHTLRAGVEISGTRMQLRTNKRGFRGHDIAIPKPKGTVRVVCIGGSTTFDILAKSDDETWPARLEKKLRAKDPSFEVVNAGVAGNTIDSFLAAETWQSIQEVEPDVVIAYFATNEISHEAQVRFQVKQSEESRVGSKALETITDWSLFAYKVWLFVDTWKKPPEREGIHDLPDEASRSFEEKLHELVLRTRALGAKPVLLSFALRWRADQPLEKRRELAAGAFSIFPGLSLEGIERAFHGYNDAIARVAAKDGCPLVPVAETLSGDPTLFGDFVHFSPDGSERMSELVAAHLDRAGLLHH
jgi:lysophospholipase L1-like esterase